MASYRVLSPLSFSAYSPHHVLDPADEIVRWKNRRLQKHSSSNSSSQGRPQLEYVPNCLLIRRGHNTHNLNFIASASSGRHGDTLGSNGLQCSSSFRNEGLDCDIDFRSNVCLIHPILLFYVLLGYVVRYDYGRLNF